MRHRHTYSDANCAQDEFSLYVTAGDIFYLVGENVYGRLGEHTDKSDYKAHNYYYKFIVQRRKLVAHRRADLHKSCVGSD